MCSLSVTINKFATVNGLTNYIYILNMSCFNIIIMKMYHTQI